jgi:hypothetical protein
MSRIARIAIESMCLAEMHCDLNRERPTLIEIKIPSDTLDPDTSAYRPPRRHWSAEFETNQAARRVFSSHRPVICCSSFSVSERVGSAPADRG